MANIMQRAGKRYDKLRKDFGFVYGKNVQDEEIIIAERMLYNIRSVLDTMIKLAKITKHLDTEEFGGVMRNYTKALRNYHDLGIVSEETYKEAVQRFEMKDLEPWD